jgi:hypothetical protein
MNLLELQVRIVISGVPESGLGPTLLDWTLPVLLGPDRRPLIVPEGIQPRPPRTETQA